jgi:PhoPQ-activated pathogenicity-related protein
MKNIVAVQPLENNYLQVKFDYGTSFKVDIKPFIKSGVSSALNDKQFFNAVRVEDGFIAWPNGYDFCPEFLYEYAIKQANF